MDTVAWDREVPGRTTRSPACADEAAQGAEGPRGSGRGTPQGGEAQESQGAARWRNPWAVAPTGRGKTPEAKPLSAEMPHRRKRGKRH